MVSSSDERSFGDRMDEKWAWSFHPYFFAGVWGAVIVVVAFGYFLSIYLGYRPHLSSITAGLGAFGACCGVVTLGRPMIRVGGYKEWLRRSRIIGGSSYVGTEKEIEEDEQLRQDAIAVQLTGPALAIVGTMVNGLSGFLP